MGRGRGRSRRDAWGRTLPRGTCGVGRDDRVDRGGSGVVEHHGRSTGTGDVLDSDLFVIIG